jgi:hypothetical protein
MLIRQAVTIAMTILERWNLGHNDIGRTSRALYFTAARTVIPAQAHDVRPDLFCGIANWFLFLDHIPNNAVSLITIRNFGFSGAADLFIFISGYTATMLYARMMLERGAIVGATRLVSRAWRLYAAYIVLFTIYIVSIGYAAAEYAAPDIIGEFNVAGLIDELIRTLGHGLLLQSKARNLDVLQLYIFLMALFPPVLWMMLRKPGITMIGSLALYCAAHWFEWNLPSFPDGSWYFNPFCWQLLFVFGAWLALGGARRYRPILEGSILLYLGIAFLIFALVVTIAGHFAGLTEVFPKWLFDSSNLDEKTNLAPYRALHFAVLAFVVARFLPKDWPPLRWRLFEPAIRCGQHSVAVFCVGVFLAFVGHFALITSSESLLMQVFVSTAGISMMTLVAYYISWSGQQDVRPSRA